MSSTEKSFLDLTTAVADRMSYPLAELNDLLTTAPGDDIRVLPQAHIGDAYRLNYVTAMVELAAHRAGVAPPTWTAAIPPLEAPVFIDPSLEVVADLYVRFSFFTGEFDRIQLVLSSATLIAFAVGSCAYPPSTTAIRQAVIAISIAHTKPPSSASHSQTACCRRASELLFQSAF